VGQVITIAFYANETNPAATIIDLPGWAAIARSVAGPDGEMIGLDLKDPERHTCEHPTNPATNKPQKDCLYKDGIAWSPVTLSEPYRLDQNVVFVNLAVFDLDHVTQDTLDECLDKLTAEKFTFVCHSTHGHKPPNDCAARIILPMSRVVTPKEWERIFSAARRTLVRAADTHCRNVSRFYFMPRVGIDAPYFFREHTGRPLDVNELLAQGHTTTPTLPVIAPVDDEPPTANLGDLRSAVTSLRRSKKESDPVAYILLERVLKGRYLALPGWSDFVDPDNAPKGRDAAINKIAAMLAFTFDPGTPTDAVVELLRPCIVNMQCDPEGPDHWLQKARDSYSRALARRIDRDNRRAEENAQLRQTLTRIIGARGTRVTHDKPVATPETPEESDEEIFAALEKGPKTGRPLLSRINIETVLERAAGTKSCIRWNEYAKRIDVVGGQFAGMKAGQVALEIASWFDRVFQLGVLTQAVKESITLTAYRHSYNPLTDYLTGVQWDGTPRLDRILIDYMTTRREGPDGADLTPLLQTFGRKWAISAVARAFAPGCQVDHVLVLEGPEGYKKTSFFRGLGGPFFAATSVKMGDKDSKMAASSAWIIEIAEMAGVKKSDNADLKAFITTTEDFYRRPYEPIYETCPRTSVFVGTVNPNDFALPSADENRRYWCVYVEAPVDTRRLEADRDQIWAEAVAAYAQGHGEDGKPEEYLWYLNPSEEALAKRLAGEKTATSPMIGRIEKWWNRLPVDARPVEFTADDLIEKLMLSNDDPAKLRALVTEIGVSLKQLGFTSKRERRGKPSRMVTVYRPTPAHLEHVDITVAPGVSATVHSLAERRKVAT
jgi:hypothetical protein